MAVRWMFLMSGQRLLTRTAFYRYALEQTGCLPNEAVMVGDRIDNDVAPAHNAGMRI